MSFHATASHPSAAAVLAAVNTDAGTTPRGRFAAEDVSQPTSLEPAAHACKWPIGTPGTEGFGFCGRYARGSYCDTHRHVGTIAVPAQENERFIKSALWAADRSAWGGRAS